MVQAVARISRAAALGADMPEDRLPIVKVIETEQAPALFNEPKLVTRLRPALEAALGQANVQDFPRIMGSEDFGNLGLDGTIPVTLFWLGVSDPAKAAEAARTHVPLPNIHSALYAPVAAPTLRTGVIAMSAAALELLRALNVITRPELDCCHHWSADGLPATRHRTSPGTNWLMNTSSSYLQHHPAFAAAQGRHEYDGRLPDWSEAGILAEANRIDRYRVRVERYPLEQLSTEERFEREYLLTRIDRELFWTKVAAAPFHNPEFYLGMSDGGDSLDPAVYVVKPYASVDRRARAFIAYAHEVVRVAPEIRRNLATPMPATYIKLGVSGFRGLASLYRKDAPLAFAAASDPALQAEMRAAIEPAARALEQIADDLARRTPTSGFSDALGARKFSQMLHMTERVDMPLDELEAALQADLDRNLKALTAACQAVCTSRQHSGLR
jgi:hypothetical protein